MTLESWKNFLNSAPPLPSSKVSSYSFFSRMVEAYSQAMMAAPITMATGSMGAFTDTVDVVGLVGRSTRDSGLTVRYLSKL